MQMRCTKNEFFVSKVERLMAKCIKREVRSPEKLEKNVEKQNRGRGKRAKGRRRERGGELLPRPEGRFFPKYQAFSTDRGGKPVSKS